MFMRNDRDFVPQTLQEGDLKDAVCSLFPLTIIFPELHVYRIAGSQNDSSCRSSCSTPLFKWSHLQQIVHDCAQMALSKDKDSTTALESPCWCSATLTAKMCFLAFRHLLCFSLCPEPLVPSLGVIEKLWLPHFCTLPDLYRSVRFPLELSLG